MWMLVPIAFAGKLLSTFRKSLSSLWGSVVPWFFWLRSAVWLARGKSTRPLQLGQGELQESRGEEEEGPDQPTKPTSVNYHFTRQCNYKCGFCFHTAKTSFVLPLAEAKRGLRLLQEAGMEKINFSGGEPFIHDRGEYLGKLVQFCKEELRLPSVSIVSNGSLIRERWFQNYGEYLDILAISCDSFDEQVNVLIGRGQGKKNHVENLQKLRAWCRDYRVAFKINSVINRFNVDEDMREEIQALNPVRWKVFQCLLIEGENSGEDALREAQQFVISDEEFEGFLDRHKEVSCLVPESNQKMKDSYLILDEYMRFLNCRNGRKDPSKSILDVGVEEAIKFSGFDEKMFLKRGGKYVWSKADLKLDW
ncbi:S-adenosylmethionine-dependent nucleotide dehydratase RSAD2 [Mirounga angustirostris]|uniref:radical S-adenosyl methionine domain-containing protein 2-like n=1 Tax=Mirounga leonina TaxID=9715 RepID=UPI00156C512A|nr:radical S-adenosyl methionine domain-containing protein 2-like [Mirounga leonina]XP_034856278.1 radical S-adenosyl methionine domain-containing protein 2-like [Mirounga leonina]XP_045739985.1 S-adenosylmethionine-dependent nucleotide dehydratase RSAD2 [Mirounga angustirostris]